MKINNAAGRFQMFPYSFINSSAGILAPYDVLWLSVIVLLLLVFFLIAGSGPLSVDRQIKK